MESIKDILGNKLNILFIVLSGFFISNALIAELVGMKIFSVEATLGITPTEFTLFGVEGLGFNMSAGVLLWPIVFIMTDVINEYFGLKAVRFLSFLTVGLILYAFVMIYGTIQLVPNEWWDSISGMSDEDPLKRVSSMSLAYNKIMGQGLWIIVGSMVAFLVGQFIDVFVFQKIKSKTGDNKVWLRATGSTLISQFIDSFVVLFIAFYIGADWEFVRVLAVGGVAYLYKFVVAVLLTPVIYLLHHWIDLYLGHEAASRAKEAAMFY